MSSAEHEQGPDQDGAAAGRALSFRYRFDDAEFDEAQSALRVQGQPVAVEPRPLQLLAELLRRPNEVVTKDELFEAVWAGRITVDHVLASAVNKLRKALGPQAGARIVNVPRVGYRFSGTVERVVVGRLADATLDLQPGQAVPGREGYRLERALDGRGLVWLARHRQLHQPRVFKFATDAERLRSLKREFTLHRVLRAEQPQEAPPGVARLVDANFAEPPFFLECEYEGPDLVAWAAEEEGRLAAMTVDERLALFMPIAEAVAAAHEVGVLHKDIKPANVLMGGEPGAWRPVLTDFGSGHVLDAERLHHLGLTAMGLTVSAATDPQALGGTAMYLAPELLGGHGATVKSDVYALGVMLYQLLAGELKRPLATGWQRDVNDELLQEDVAAATQGDAARRVASVRELVGRLGALQARRADRKAASLAAAQQAQLTAELQRRRARRPWLTAAFASLVVGLAGTLWFYIASRGSLQQAQEAATNAQAISEFLHRDVLEAPEREAMRAATEPTTLLQVLRKASLRASERFADQPRIEGAMRRRLAEAYMKAAAWPDARAEINKSLTLLGKHAAESDGELLAARFVNARILAFLPATREGFAELEGAEQLAGPARLDRPSELAMLASRARHELLMFSHRHAEAAPQARRLLQIVEALTREGSPERVDALRRVGEVAVAMENDAEAQAAFARLAAPPYLVKTAAHEAHANVHINRGERARQAGRLDEALAEFEQARDWMDRAGEGRNEFYAAWAEFEVSTTNYRLGRLEPALRSSERAQALFRRAMGEDHQYVIVTQLDRAGIVALQGDIVRALALYDEANAIQTRAYGNRRPFRGWIEFGRAHSLTGLGRPREAIALLESIRGLDYYTSNWPEALERIDFEIGRARWMLGERSRGLEMMQAALEAMPNKGTWPWVVEHQREVLRKLQAAR
ncbi:MAG: winged helix-turn-helix domain-containing protein [Rubrivivax sp.]|nr:winged helix-turn-helix domain-containing protein [Rubrivivax sp.]